MKWDKVAWAGFIGLGTYVVGGALLFKWQLEAYSYLEVRGYINGIVRETGSMENAMTTLDNWRNYWYDQGSWQWLVDHFYNYGIERAQIVYGG